MEGGKEVNKGEVDLIKKGWEALVKGIGYLGATKFIVTLERTGEDSIEQITRYWGDKTVDDIHNLIMQAREAGKI